MAQADLSEDDAAVLGHIGAVLYRKGLRRRMGIRPDGITDEQRGLYRLALKAIGLRSATADAALNQLNTVSAQRRRRPAQVGEHGSRCLPQRPHDPAVPIHQAKHCQSQAAALAEYCRHRFNDTF